MRLGLGPYPGTPIKARGVVHSEEKMLSWRKTSQETKQRKKRTKVWRADAQRRIRGQAGARRWAATVRNFSRTMGSMPARLERPFHPSIVVVRYYCIGRCCESSRSGSSWRREDYWRQTGEGEGAEIMRWQTGSIVPAMGGGPDQKGGGTEASWTSWDPGDSTLVKPTDTPG